LELTRLSSGNLKPAETKLGILVNQVQLKELIDMPTSNTRQHDDSSSPPPSRSERVFAQEDLWYFRIREGENIGPFRYKSEAESNLDQFMTHLKHKLR